MPKSLIIVAATVLTLHGLIHLMGTAAYALRIEVRGLGYKTVLFGGRLDLGERGIRIFGWLWTLPAIAFVASAVALLAGWQWTLPLLAGATVFSLALTAADWSKAFMGAVCDMVILAILTVEFFIAA